MSVIFFNMQYYETGCELRCYFMILNFLHVGILKYYSLYLVEFYKIET